jgi:hypothetical protein
VILCRGGRKDEVGGGEGLDVGCGSRDGGHKKVKEEEEKKLGEGWAGKEKESKEEEDERVARGGDEERCEEDLEGRRKKTFRISVGWQSGEAGNEWEVGRVVGEW